MKISCPSCEAKYSIGDDKVQSRLAKIRCRKCGVDIVIDGRVQPPTVTVGDAAAAQPTAAAAESATSQTTATGHTYTIDFGESDQRQMTLDEVVSAYNEGYITPETFVWTDGMTDWTPLGQVTEIVEALNTAAAVAPAVEAAPAIEAAPAVEAAPAPVSTPRPAEQPATSAFPRATSARTQTRGGTDLFGAIAHAGSEEDMAQQASHEPVAPQPTTGARNESSVLFSLSALTASAKPASSATSSLGISSPATTSKEDSGLIDLKALTSQASNAAVATANTVGLGAPAPLGGLGAPLGGLGAPLGGLGAPLGGGAVPASAGLGAAPLGGDYGYPQKKNRTGLYILGAAGILAVAVVLGIALQPSQTAPVKVEATPVVIPKATTEPEPIKAVEAKPPSTGEAPAATASATPETASTVAKANVSVPTKSKAGSATKKPTSTAATTEKPTSTKTTTSDTPAPKKPAASKCGCAAGDLACAMRCAAKGG